MTRFTQSVDGVFQAVSRLPLLALALSWCVWQTGCEAPAPPADGPLRLGQEPTEEALRLGQEVADEWFARTVFPQEYAGPSLAMPMTKAATVGRYEIWRHSRGALLREADTGHVTWTGDVVIPLRIEGEYRRLALLRRTRTHFGLSHATTQYELLYECSFMSIAPPGQTGWGGIGPPVYVEVDGTRPFGQPWCFSFGEDRDVLFHVILIRSGDYELTSSTGEMAPIPVSSMAIHLRQTAAGVEVWQRRDSGDVGRGAAFGGDLWGRHDSVHVRLGTIRRTPGASAGDDLPYLTFVPEDLFESLFGAGASPSPMPARRVEDLPMGWEWESRMAFSGADHRAPSGTPANLSLRLPLPVGEFILWADPELGRAVLVDASGKVLWAGRTVIVARKEGRPALLYLIGWSALYGSTHGDEPTEVSVVNLAASGGRWRSLGVGYVESGRDPRTAGDDCLFDIDEDGTDEFFYWTYREPWEADPLMTAGSHVLVMYSGGVEVLSLALTGYSTIRKEGRSAVLETVGKPKITRVIRRGDAGQWIVE